MTSAPESDVLATSAEEISAGILRVVETDPRVDTRYEAFVAAHPDALIYHHPAWLQVLSRENGNSPVCLACEDGAGRLRGVLPLFATRGLPVFGRHLTGRRLSSLPRTPLAGPLASDAQATTALLRAAKERVSARVDTHLQIKRGAADLEGLVEEVQGSLWRPYYVVTLPNRIEDLRFGNSRNHARIRSTVNKAEQSNIRIRHASSERDLRAWYGVYLHTMRWHGIPPRSYRFFLAAWDLLQPLGLMRLLLAELHESGRTRLLAGSIFLMFGQTCFYAFNGCRRDAFSVQPNDVIQWRAIHDACREGFRYYDLGEVPGKNDGLSFFKSKWGADERWMYRYYYPAPSELGTRALDAPLPVLKATWRHLPLRVTAIIGDHVYRYL